LPSTARRSRPRDSRGTSGPPHGGLAAAAVIRSRNCEGLGFLDIDLDAARNNANAPIITTKGSHVTVRVIRTDEELQIARAVLQLLGHTQEKTA
jgi:acetate kinase